MDLEPFSDKLACMRLEAQYSGQSLAGRRRLPFAGGD